jgi:GNAT superfamily N-acetyltransferase
MTVTNDGMPQIIVITNANIMLIKDLLDESVQQGFLFIQKTFDEWNDGSNSFSKPGEQLWGLLLVNKLVGIGGLNQDPYDNNPNTGRVRHLYIKQAYRRRKYATTLLNQIKSTAKPTFNKLRLFTDNPAAGLFYEAAGFKKTDGHKVSHELTLYMT